MDKETAVIASLYPTKLPHTHMSSQPCKPTRVSKINIKFKCWKLLNTIKRVMFYFHVGNLNSIATVSCSIRLPLIPLYCKTAQPPYNTQ